MTSPNARNILLMRKQTYPDSSQTMNVRMIRTNVIVLTLSAAHRDVLPVRDRAQARTRAGVPVFSVPIARIE